MTAARASSKPSLRDVGLLVAPVIVFLGVLVFLAFRNATAELYVDVVSTEFAFDVVGLEGPGETVDLVSNLPVDSLQLAGGELRLVGATIRDDGGRLLPTGAGSIAVGAADPALPSRIRLARSTSLQLRSLTVPVSARVVLSREGSIVRIGVESRGEQGEATPFGRIGLGTAVVLAGENMSLPGFDYADGAALSVETDPRYRTAAFEGPPQGALGLQLFLGDDAGERWGVILGNVTGTNVRFQVVDRTLAGGDRLRSGIEGGTVLIGGVDLTGRRFLLREEDVKQAEFLELNPADRYLVDYVRLSGDDLAISLFAEAATDIGTGKRSRFVRSIFPSVLDVVVAEPAKKTLWTALLFLLAQLAAIGKAWSGLSPRAQGRKPHKGSIPWRRT